MKYKFSWKFYIGALLVIMSFVVAKVAQVIFVIYYNISFWKWFAIILYIATWPMLVLGVWWVGKEYAQKIKKYFGYRYYHEAAKKRTKKVYKVAKKRLKRK